MMLHFTLNACTFKHGKKFLQVYWIEEELLQTLLNQLHFIFLFLLQYRKKAF